MVATATERMAKVKTVNDEFKDNEPNMIPCSIKIKNLNEFHSLLEQTKKDIEKLKNFKLELEFIRPSQKD